MATITKRGDSWVLNWHDLSGQHRKVIGKINSMSKREAEAICKTKELHLFTGTHTDTFGGRRVKVKEAIDSYILWRSATFPASNKTVEKAIRRMLFDNRTWALEALNTAWISSWLTERRQKVKTSTLTAQFNQLRTFLRWCDEHGMKVDNNVLKLSPPKSTESAPPMWYTQEQLNALYEVSGEYGIWWKLIANTGLRREEALSLHWENVKDNELHIISKSHSRTKSGKWRIVPLSPGAREALDVLRKEKRDTVLPEQTSNALTWKFIYYAKKCGIGGSLHKLRHTFASTLVMSGTPLHTVQVLLGHSSITTTEIYTHLSAEHLHDAVKGLTI